MKILIISDIHSNYEALLSVAHAERSDAVWCLGDLVDFGHTAGGMRTVGTASCSTKLREGKSRSRSGVRR